jgi:Restriction endonuclease NaeI
MGPAAQADKTHTGTLVEIALARSLRLADGATLDYTIAGADVECEFSSPHSLVIPLETHDKLMLVVMPMPVRGDGDPGHVVTARSHWWRSQTPKFWPPFDSTDGLITTAPDVLALMVSTISLVAQGPRMVPLSPL